MEIPWQRKELPSLGSKIPKKQAAESRVSYPLPVTPVRTKMDFLDNKEKMLTGGGGQCPKEAGHLCLCWAKGMSSFLSMSKTLVTDEKLGQASHQSLHSPSMPSWKRLPD